MVEIVEYQESWPTEFQAIGGELRRGLRHALRIDHIGSTAVPGLAAKDIIDVQITVASLTGPISSELVALGYAAAEGINRDHVPPKSEAPMHEWDKLFFRPPSGQRRTNTHVRVENAANSLYPLL